MQQAHHNRRAANGEANGDQAQAGTKANRHHSKVDLVAHVGIEGADEAPAQWTIRVMGNFHPCVAMNVSFEAQQAPRNGAWLTALQLAVDALNDETSRMRGVGERPHLTGRMREALLLAQQGLTSPEIAKQLCISRYTVDTHISRACAKLHASGRREAIQTATRLGLL